MSEKIKSIKHRHSDQKSSDPDLVLEVGKRLPPFYQAGRPSGVQVKRIDGDDPVICSLENGELIFIRKHSVSAFGRAEPES